MRRNGLSKSIFSSLQPPGWETILAKHTAELMLVSMDASLHEAIPRTSGWSRAYQDYAYLLFARDGIELPLQDDRGVKLLGTFA